MVEEGWYAGRTEVHTNPATNDDGLGMIYFNVLATDEANQKRPKRAASLICLQRLVEVLGSHVEIIPCIASIAIAMPVAWIGTPQGDIFHFLCIFSCQFCNCGE